MLASDEIKTVSMIVLFPEDKFFIAGITLKAKLAKKLTATNRAMTLSFFAGGIIMAMNIP